MSSINISASYIPDMRMQGEEPQAYLECCHSIVRDWADDTICGYVDTDSYTICTITFDSPEVMCAIWQVGYDALCAILSRPADKTQKKERNKS